MCSMKTCWQDAKNCSLNNNTWNQYLYLQLLIKKRNIKSKKYGSTGNEAKKYSIWYIGRIMEMSITNGLQNQGYLMQKRQLKTIGQGFWVKTYKERGIKSYFDSL